MSATHLDWTMIPYVRKSFYKHWRDGSLYIENLDIATTDHPEDISIEDNGYTALEKAYEYAIKMTEKEVRQAAEGMFHNLNSLLSRSGN